MTTKVFCKDCKNKRAALCEVSEVVCLATVEVEYHPIHGEQYIHPKCCEKNKNFNCPDYEEPTIFDGVSGLMLCVIMFLVVVYILGFVLYKLTMMGG